MPNASLIHADIFFFVSTVSLALITIGIIIVFVYLIGILKNVREITDKGREEWNEIVADSKRLRVAVRDEGMRWKYIADAIRMFVEHMLIPKKKKVPTPKAPVVAKAPAAKSKQ